VIVLVNVILANHKVPPMQPMPPAPLSSLHVLFADTEVKQVLCKLVTKPQGTNKCIASETHGQRGSITIGQPTERLDMHGP